MPTTFTKLVSSQPSSTKPLRLTWPLQRHVVVPTNDNPYRFIGCAYVMHIHIRASKTDLRMRACYLM